jgi:carboxyl-terminal processing protease
VLDLRENSGGFLNQAIRVAGLFMTSGVVVISKYSHGQVRYLRNIDGRIYYDGPLVILTSQASASAAEIVAQALQDYGTALVVGDERTYGKGTIQYQTVTDARAQAYFKVTIGRYYTVSGRSTQMDGVKADLVVPTPFAAFRIGERYLEYSLRSDRMPSAYHDPLSDLDIQTKAWFQKNYLPNLQLKQSRWQEMLPELRKKSEARMAANPVCQQFVKELHEIQAVGSPSYANRNWWRGEDWQITEAIEILKDMISSQ